MNSKGKHEIGRNVIETNFSSNWKKIRTDIPLATYYFLIQLNTEGDGKWIEMMRERFSGSIKP
jgi:hypothetical protein